MWRSLHSVYSAKSVRFRWCVKSTGSSRWGSYLNASSVVAAGVAAVSGIMPGLTFSHRAMLRCEAVMPAYLLALLLLLLPCVLWVLLVVLLVLPPHVWA